jgi:dolichol kinase
MRNEQLWGQTGATSAFTLHSWQPSTLNPGSRKTVEGTAGGVAVTLAAWGALLAAAGGGTLAAVAGPGAAGWAALVAATAAACLLEASTTQLDNVFVPLHLFALLCLL